MTWNLIFVIIYAQFGRSTILFYNWHKIFKETDGKAKDIVLILRMLVMKDVAYSYYDPLFKYLRKDFKGYSYLLHPKALLHDAYKYSYSDVARYIGLAARRPYSEYVVNRISALDLRDLSFDPIAYFDNQDLVEVRGDYLHFRYE